MKINITEKGDGTFGLFFDGEEIPLSAQDLKTLLVQITQLLAPDPAIAREADARNQRFLGRVKEAVPKSQIASAFERLNGVADDVRSKGRTDL